MTALELVETTAARPHLRRALDSLDGETLVAIVGRARRELEQAWDSIGRRVSRRPAAPTPADDDDDAAEALGPAAPVRDTGGIDPILVEACVLARASLLLLAERPALIERITGTLELEREDEARAREARRRRHGAWRREPAAHVLDSADADHLGDLGP